MSIGLTIEPLEAGYAGVSLQAESMEAESDLRPESDIGPESNTAIAVGLCERQQALMFRPDDPLEINNQEVVGLILPEETFTRIQHDIAEILPDDRSLKGTSARLSHEDTEVE